MLPRRRDVTRLRRWSGLVLTGVLLAVCSTPGWTQPVPYEIEAILSLTGSGAFLGKASATALSVVEQLVNKDGGIRGRPLKFVIADDQSTPAVAVQLLNGSIARHATVVMGSSLVGACNAMAALIPNGPVVYCFSGGMQPAKGSYMFAFGGNLLIQVPVSMRYLRARGLKKIAILATTDASGKDGEHNVDLALALPENRDMTIVDREYFSAGDVSISAQIAKIKASGAQAITMWATGTNAGTAFRGMQDAGLDIPTVMSAANAIGAQMKQYAALLPRDVYSAIPPCTVYDDLPNGPLKRAVGTFVAAFKAAGYEPDVPLAIGWDPGLIVANALRALGPDATPAQLRDSISSLRGWSGASGDYDFRDGSQRGLTSNSMIMVRWDPTRSTFVAISKLGGAPR